MAKKEVEEGLSYKEWAFQEKLKKVKNEPLKKNEAKREYYTFKKTQAYKDRIEAEAKENVSLSDSRKTTYVRKEKRPVIVTCKGEFDFLKYYRLVIYWASKQYEITRADLELLFYFYNEKPFTKDQFEDACYVMMWDKNRLDRFLEEGILEEYAVRGETGRINSVPIYKLSLKTRRRIASIYDRLTLKYLISEENKNSKIFRLRSGYSDKQYAKAIAKMNVKARELRNGESEYYLDEDLKYV
jgi:hypothetical protein